MKTIFLSGGGDEKQTRKFDSFFARSFKKGARVLYIPVAMKNSTKFTMGGCFNWISAGLGQHHISNIDMWTTTHDRSWDNLDEYAAIYIGGGNTFDLWNEFTHSGFDRLLKRFIASGRPVYGGSAGAIILGKDIRTASIGTAADENRDNLRKNTTLNQANGWVVHCHYTPKDDSFLLAECKKRKWKVLALPEETGAIVSGPKIFIQGTKPAVLFSAKGKKKVPPGKIV